MGLNDTLLDQLERAIREKNEPGVRDVLARGAKGRLSSVEEMPAAHAVEQRHLPILKAVATHFNGKGLALAYAFALETEWRAGADVLWDAGQAKPPRDQLYLIQALKEASKFGLKEAVHQLTERMGRVIGQESAGGVGVINPLTAAVQADQTAILKILLNCTVDPVLCDDAVEMAAIFRKPDCLKLVWPQARPLGRAKAVQATLEKDGWDDAMSALAHWLVPQVTPQAFEGLAERDAQHLQQALTAAAGHGHAPFLEALLSLTDPKNEKSEALRKAVEQERGVAIRFLLPHSEPKEARKFWLTRHPPQWELVDRLSVYLSPEQQKAWARDMTQMPRLKAIQKAATALTNPPDTPTRRRLRS